MPVEGREAWIGLSGLAQVSSGKASHIPIAGSRGSIDMRARPISYITISPTSCISLPVPSRPAVPHVRLVIPALKPCLPVSDLASMHKSAVHLLSAVVVAVLGCGLVEGALAQ